MKMSTFMTEKEEQKFEAHLAKKSTILVVGQTNSGKSSFLNELLGDPYLPTAQVPCTSQIVRLKYSEQNYIQLDERNAAKLNVCKARDDHVPYPDGKAPFYVPQVEPADHAPEESGT